MRYLESFSGEALVELGMSGYRIATPNKVRQRKFEEALELFRSHALQSPFLRDHLQILEQEAQEIVWLKECGVHEVFASAAYPELPGKIFVTDAIFVGLPPDVQLSGLHPYAVIENLVHESLHHDLHRQLLNRSEADGEDLISKLQDQVRIPWRNTTWSVEKALHALKVYQVVLHLRVWALDELNFSTEDQLVMQASLPTVRSIIETLSSETKEILSDLQL